MEDISDNQLLDEMEVSCEKDKDIAGKETMHTPKSNDGEHGSKPITRNIEVEQFCETLYK
jgi:hypothetical protein